MLSIVDAFTIKNQGFSGFVTGIVLGVLEILMDIYSVAHPTILAISLGILTGLYFIESGVNMIFPGFTFSIATAIDRQTYYSTPLPSQ